MRLNPPLTAEPLVLTLAPQDLSARPTGGIPALIFT